MTRPDRGERHPLDAFTIVFVAIAAIVVLWTLAWVVAENVGN